MSPECLAVVCIAFVAGLQRGLFGFGDAMLGMPLLVLSVGLSTATPLFGVLGLLLTLGLIYPGWRDIQFRSVGVLLLAALVGLPLGISLLKFVERGPVLALLGISILSYSIFRLLGGGGQIFYQDRWGVLFGFVAGVLGGAYNVAGPPLITYATLRGWSPAQFRASLQGFFLVTGVMICISHGLAGLYNQTVLYYVLISLPLLAVGLALGSYLHARVPVERFARAVYVVLAALGALMLLQAYLS